MEGIANFSESNVSIARGQTHVHVTYWKGKDLLVGAYTVPSMLLRCLSGCLLVAFRLGHHLLVRSYHGGPSVST